VLAGKSREPKEVDISRIDSILLNLGYMDLLSYRDSRVHSLDPRAKLFTTVLYIITVMSLGKYEIAMLAPFVIYPMYLMSAGDIPFNYIIKKVAYISPFVFFVAIFNPVFDREVLLYAGNAGITGGWVSFLSIMIRFVLTVGTALAMIAGTGFYNVCMALERMGVPSIFAVQLLFLYRYLFVLGEEAARMLRARGMRSFGNRGRGLKTFGPMAGTLLLRTINRGHRIYLAMTCRGFDGTIRRITPLAFTARDAYFTLTWCALFLVFRFFNIPGFIGAIASGLLT
jgi:cobalt/nickel transport system permease protein